MPFTVNWKRLDTATSGAECYATFAEALNGTDLGLMAADGPVEVNITDSEGNIRLVRMIGIAGHAPPAD